MKPKVFIAIPTVGNMRTELAMFLLQLKQNDYDVRMSFTLSGGVIHNRNLLVKSFLETDCEWFLFIDSDTVPPSNILDMIENNKTICSGVSHIYKDNNFSISVYGKYKGKLNYIQEDSKEDLIEVDGVGTGCLLIHRKVFDRLNKPYFETVYDKNGMVEVSEDLNFCKKAQEAKFKIWVDKRMVVSHYKTVNLSTVWTMLARKGEKNNDYSKS